MIELVAEFSSAEYMTDTKSSRLTWIPDHATLDLFEEVGAEAVLLALLRQALGTREGIEIVWSKA
jgi:hypothetical protein